MNDELWATYNDKTDALFSQAEVTSLIDQITPYTQINIDNIWNIIKDLIKDGANNIIPSCKTTTKINKPKTDRRIILPQFYIHLRRLQQMQSICSQKIGRIIPEEMCTKYDHYIAYIKSHFPKITLSILTNCQYTDDFLRAIKHL